MSKYDPSIPPGEREAYYGLPKEVRFCSECVMCYPPGIPILAPGERITKDILDYIRYAKAKGCSMTGPEDPTIENINVLA